MAALDYEAPHVNRVPAAEVPTTLRPRSPRHCAAIDLSFTFGQPRPPWRYRELFLRVRLDDPSTSIVDVRTTANRIGTPAINAAPVSIWSTGNAIGCLFSLPDSGIAQSVTCVLRAILDIPSDLTVLTGATHAEASIWRRLAPLVPIRYDHLRVEASPFFSLEVPRDWFAGEPTPLPAQPSAAVRLCIAADIERFSRFHSPQATRAQLRFVAALARARQHAGIDEALVDLQKGGDGQLAILPPALDESNVIPRFVEGLAQALAETNADLNDHARLRIRVALHRGHVSWGINGWIGDSTIAVHRILDCPAIRSALRANPASDFALIVPDTLYRDVIAHEHGGLNPERFAAVTASLPDKQFIEQAWIHVP